MVKHFQTIRRVLQKNCLSVCDHFVGLERAKCYENRVFIVNFEHISQRFLVFLMLTFDVNWEGG